MMNNFTYARSEFIQALIWAIESKYFRDWLLYIWVFKWMMMIAIALQGTELYFKC